MKSEYFFSLWRWCHVKLNLAPCWLMSSSRRISSLKIHVQVKFVMSRCRQEERRVCLSLKDEVRVTQLRSILLLFFRKTSTSTLRTRVFKRWSSIKKNNRPHRQRDGLVHHGPAAPPASRTSWETEGKTIHPPFDAAAAASQLLQAPNWEKWAK